MSVKAEYLAVDSLAAWLRLKLPAKVTAVNLTRAAVLKTPVAGPFTIPASASIKLSLVTKDGTPTTVSLTSGVRTTAQLVTQINSGFGSSIASADADDRLALTGAAPLAGSPSAVFVGADATGANAALGWEAGGESVINTALEAPGHRNVMDGWPQQLDAQAGFIIVIGKRTSILMEKGGAKSGVRSDEHLVTLELAVFRPAVQQENHRSREHIHACMQCIREVLKTDAGLQLGRASTGDVVAVEVGRGSVAAMRFQPIQRGKPFGPAFDSGDLTVYVKVFERPDAS